MSTLVDAPTRVDGVQLIGEMVGSGYRNPPALVRRSDGQVLQLTPLLYLVLVAADGRRTCTEIADVVGGALGRHLTENDVRTLVDGHLRPRGLLRRADGTEPELERSNPLLSLKARVAVTNPRVTRRLTDPFRVLFRAPVAMAIVAVFLAVVAWVFFERGLGASAYDAFERPHLLLLVFVVSILSGGFHEFGHAAATRYGGGQPGVMGAGIYLVWPAFYTDVTDSYRLDRRGRIRTDLGGLYFNAVVVVVTFIWWWATGWEALLLLVATQVLQMVQQALPLLRFDGYHLLADLAGVPDLYQRIKPTLLGLLPHRWGATENRVLKPWARAVITLWVLVTIPMMALMLLAVIRAVPRLFGSAGSVIQKDVGSLVEEWRTEDYLSVAGDVLQVLGVVLPMLACVLIVGRTGLRFFAGLFRWSRGSAGKRLAAAVVSGAVITALAWAWWPDPGTYRPIQRGERGLVTSLLPVSRGTTAGSPGAGSAGESAVRAGLGTGRQGGAARERLASSRPLVAAFQEDAPLPTEDHPQLAMVLVPSGGGSDGRPPSGAGGNDPVWVFPFDKPLPPAEGDNQALAVTIADGSVSYDVAFALVWVEDDEVLNINEAHAYASCTDCVAIAVAFQVVLIMDDAHVVVPQNLAVAANYDCHQCITAAIASQLVLSVQTEPGRERLQALASVWSRLAEFASTITTRTLTEIAAQLEGFKAEIVAILGDAPVLEQQSVTTAVPSPSASRTTGTTHTSGTSTPSTTQGTTSDPPVTTPAETATSTPTATQPTAPEPAVTTSPSAIQGATTASASPSP